MAVDLPVEERTSSSSSSAFSDVGGFSNNDNNVDSAAATCGGVQVVTTTAVVVVTALFVTGFVALYSGMGIGVRFVILSARYEWASSAMLAGGVFCVLLLHAWDSLTTKRRVFWRPPLLLLAAILGLCGIILGVDRYAYGPLCLFAAGLPAWLVAVHWIALRNSLSASDFVELLPAPLTACGILAGAAWILWATWTPRHGWRRSRERYGARLSANGLRCRRTREESWMDDGDIKSLEPYERCFEVFALWVGPWCFAWLLLIYGRVTRFVSSSKRAAGNKLGLGIFFVAVGAWVAASLAGAGHGVGSALVACVAAAALAAVGVGSYVTGGASSFKKRVIESGAFSAAVAKFVEPYADWWRGLAVVSLWPLLIAYVPLEALRQFLRRCRRRRFDDAIRDDDGWLTAEATKRLGTALGWNWTKVLNAACVLGLLNIALVVVVAKFTVLLMSIVVARSDGVSIQTATAIIVGVGLMLFLLPPVPGAPIYLAAGVLLVPVGRSNGWTVSTSVAYAASICLAIKLVACACQQKLIGEPLAASLWVRKTVRINSTLIRTTRLVLREPGLSIPKVALLVGGPDWPTSVLCGILKLRLAPILVGTLPIWALIWPTVLGGAFLVVDESSAQVLSAVFVGLAATVQSGSLVVAAVYLDAETRKRSAQLDDIPFDLDVQREDERDAVRRRVYDEKTHWSRVPTPWRACLGVAVALLTFACYLTTLYPSACFRDFAVNDTVSKHLEGRWTRIVKPLGLAAIIFSLLAFLLFLLFNRAWAAKQLLQHGEVELVPPTKEATTFSSTTKTTSFSDDDDSDDDVPGVGRYYREEDAKAACNYDDDDSFDAPDL